MTICTKVYILVHIRWSMWLSSIYMYISDDLCDYILYVCTYHMIYATIFYIYVHIYIILNISHVIYIYIYIYAMHIHTLVNVIYMYHMPYTYIYIYIQTSRCKYVCMYVWVGAYSHDYLLCICTYTDLQRWCAKIILSVSAIYVD